MTERRRLLEESADPLELQLLRSWQHDRLDRKVVARTVAALGLGTASTLGAGSTWAGAQAVHSASVGLTYVAHAVAIKWMAGGLLCGLGVLAGVRGGQAVLAGNPPSEPTRHVTAQAVAPDPRGPSPSAASSHSRDVSPGTSSASDEQHVRTAQPAPETSWKGSVAKKTARTAPGEQAASAVPPSTPTSEPATLSAARMPGVPPSIAGETAALDRARAALRRGDAKEALAAANEVAGSDNSGTFGPELQRIRAEATEVLRVRAPSTRQARVSRGF
jgi:hypothetical protein